MEQITFPRRELHARDNNQEWQRRAQFERLDYLLLGDKADSLRTLAEDYRRVASLPAPRGKTSLLQAMKVLFGGTSPCNLSALESTLFFSIFDLPPTRKRFEEGLDIHHLQAELDRAYRNGLKDTGSLENVYLKLRPVSAERALGYVDHLLLCLATLEAMRLGPSPRRANSPPQPLDALRCGGNLETALQDSEGGSLQSTRLDGGAEYRALIRGLQHHMRMAAEPLRIQVYLRAKVEEIQGALRASLPEATTEKLLESTGKALYRDERALARLAETPTPQILDTLERILDKWFRAEALPSLQESLYNDPFSAYWFFVQTGAVAHGPLAYKDSHVHLQPGALSLDSLKGLPLATALARLRRESVPPDFVAAHADLERAFTDVIIEHDDVLQKINSAMLDPKCRAKLRQHFAAQNNQEALSTADTYGLVLRDAHKIGGKLDRDLLRCSLELLDKAKRERVHQVLPELLQKVPPERRARLEGYLETLSELMFELELGQATDKHFQEATTGGFTGWILSHFLMSTGVPIELWTPGGVTGEEFADLLDELAPRNKKSGNHYRGKPTQEIRLLHDGREFHQALLDAIETSNSFLNMTSFDWKLDQGGKEVAYRLMAKRLGIEANQFDNFLDTFREGLALAPAAPDRVLLYDIPPRQMKNLLIYFFFRTSPLPVIAEVRRNLESALGGELTCPSVATCGDLTALRTRAGGQHNPGRGSLPAYQQVWEAYRSLQNLFDDRPADLRATRPRSSLADYVAVGERLQTFVRRYGRKRKDDPAQPFPINIIVDGKQDLFNLHFIRPARRPPFFYSDPYWNLYAPLYEFDIRLLLWKGVLEFPWHFLGAPLPGRKVFHYLPFPYLPYPWLRFVPGFGPAGIFGSLLLQQMLAADPRTWWAMVVHAKSVSSDAVAIESGMGFATKYFDGYDNFSTWHDMGVEVKGPIIGEVNDHFVHLFNEARVNNAGLPGSHKVQIPRLRYADYQYTGPDSLGCRSWIFVTHPEKGDASYRGAFMAALAAARKNIYIETPWLTDPLVPRMLLHKAREFRGRVNCAGLGEFECSTKMREAVKIYLVLPDATDQHALDVVGRAELREMLHLGVKISWWSPPIGWSASKMLHTKAWLIDYEEGEPALAYLGSANATQRSHLADNEIGIVSTSPDFARQSYERLFRHDLTTDTRLESPETFHFPWASKRLAHSGRRLQRLLVGLFWFF